MTIEQKVFFPATRWLFLLAALAVSVLLGVYIVSYMSERSSSPPTGPVAVQLHDVLPKQSLSAADGSNESRNGPGNEPAPTLEQMYPNCTANELVKIFTSTGLYNERGVNAELIRKLEMRHVDDTPVGYIKNACEVLNRVPPAGREAALETYDSIRMRLFEDAASRRASELMAAEQKQEEYKSQIGIYALVLLQAVLVLCMLGIERNTRNR